MRTFQKIALLLAFAILCPVALAACGSDSAVRVTGQTTTQSTAAATTAIPTTATVTTTAKLPETEPPVTTPPAVTTDKPGTTTTPPVTTAKPITTTPPVTTPKPITTTPPVTTAKPITTAPPVTTTPPETAAPPAPETTDPPATQPQRTVLLYEDFKAIWISQYDMWDVYTENKAQREEASYTALVRTMLDNVKSLGFNTIFLQVRPNADSMYPSDVYPLSQYVVGTYGAEAVYDPVAIFVEEAHRRDLSIHAWINPLRGMKTTEITAVGSRYKIRQWYDDATLRGKYVVEYNGTYYLNPAYQEVRDLIVEGAAELLSRYAFDGLHMDDYFYPTTNASFDQAAYADYTAGGGRLSLADFRRAQLDLLVSALYAATKAECSDLPYGISPAGNIAKVYDEHFADVYNWCANAGYIDYICPQDYFGFEHATLDFVSVCTAWRDIIQTDSVRLIIGVTFGKALDGFDNWAGNGKLEWSNHKDILRRSLEYTATLTHCTGISVFCYQYFYDPVSGAAVDATAEETANFSPLLQEISWKRE